MYYVSKRLEIAGAHFLELSYDSPCTQLHGHNWIVTVHCRAEQLNDNGMVIDFKEIKEKIHGKLDHKVINHVVAPINPTAENLAKWIHDQIPSCYKVEVQESDGNVATYEEDWDAS
jgi:6-pyruvoyltetrahydropterin/6-carboxytetrahydropterin synthase